EFRYNLGDHQLKAGIDAEYSKSYNLFVRDNYGTYTYNFVNHWLQDLRPFNYTRSFSLVDKIVGDGSAAAAKFNSVRAAVFAGDQWQVNDKLELNYGVRVDYFDFLTTPNTDNYFNNTALPVLSSFWDMKGARSGQKPDAQVHIAPRIGFIYEPEKGFKIRGGAGVFTGRLPLVWPGGAFNNTGVNIGGINVNNPNITFRPDPFNQYQPTDLGVTVATPSGQIDLMAKDLKLPKVLKTSFGFDRTFGKGWKMSSDFLYQYHLNEVVYLNAFSTPRAKNDLGQDVYLPITGSTVGSYSRLDFDPNTAGIQNPYSTGIFVVANGTGKKGFSYNWTFSIDKSTLNGWNFNATYGWGDSYTLFDGTSSQNNSQWRFVEARNGRNNIQRSRSDFAQLHRINAYVSKKVTYLGKFLGTTLTLFYNGQSGTPYSYVYSRSMIYDQNGGNAETTDLIYVPKDFADWARFAEAYTSGTSTVTVAQQWERFDAYISADKYLSRRRGQFVERNGANLPFSHVVDMRIQQDLNLGRGKNSHKVSVIFDMFNFTNFLNREWGRIYVTPGVDAFSLISMEGYRVNTATNTLTPRFTYRNMLGSYDWPRPRRCRLDDSHSSGYRWLFISQGWISMEGRPTRAAFFFPATILPHAGYLCKKSDYMPDSIIRAIEDIRNGRMVIVVDDEDRENEGDFIIAARHVTPEVINFMSKHGRGLICAALPEDRCEELGLELMVNNNTALHETAFTVSVDLLGH
ncbi:MAG: hypothetical protein EBZ67_14005, partial [Chitinophagia bacterium]|nr:hypothetical protein [Chitinophagia bacterium]